jgi:phosphopantothenoylcysteine decarboxylase / phosphopantothenate---cysteine ligase
MGTTILKGKKVLITAGPTREAIDPVRFISNHSSGKMGYAIAHAFLQQGADVTLISGPVCLKAEPHSRLNIIQVQSATDMYMACCRHFENSDIAVFAAAVADYRTEKVSAQKIKKQEDSFTIKMVKNIDIAFEFGKVKNERQVSIGFALETNDELAHAIGKLDKKNFDMVILNSVNDANATFGFDTNKITIIHKDYTQKAFPLKPKQEVAHDIVMEIATCLTSRESWLIDNSVAAYENMYR